MGAVPSKPLATPARPFERQQQGRAACLTNAFHTKTRQGPSVMLQLISRQEWQKVLIRATLFPAEIAQRQKMTWYGVEWSLLPLHLACALQPPPPVIAMLLHFHSDTAHDRMTRSRPIIKRRWRRLGKRRKTKSRKELESHNRVKKNDTAPSSDEGEDSKGHVDTTHVTDVNSTMDTERVRKKDAAQKAVKGRGSFDESLEDSAFDMDGNGILHVFEVSEDETDSGAEQSVSTVEYKEPPRLLDDFTAESSKNSFQNFLGRRGLVLQLSSNGCLEPFPPTRTPLPSPPFGMRWNLEPLLSDADEILPLHIACLYRAAPQVVQLLLEAYPKGAQTPAMGMLPIHIACARFDLPAPVAAPPRQVPFPMEDEYDLVEDLKLLVKAFPESLDWPSEYNGMTPQMYIEETVDEGNYKNQCLHELGVEIVETENGIQRSRRRIFVDDEVSDGYVGTSSGPSSSSWGASSESSYTIVPSEVQWDDSSTIPSVQTGSTSSYLGQHLPQINAKSGTPLYARMSLQDWEVALALIEEDPRQAAEWQYGIELDRIETQVDEPQLWKRLPIHSACVLHAPIGVIEALNLANPKGISTADPVTGSLPLHLACRHGAPHNLVKAVVVAHPVGAQVADNAGRLPLHNACRAGASRLTFIYLLKAYPRAVLIKDERRKTPLHYAQMNQSMKEETIELLEMVKHFLERQSPEADDYKFEGFTPSRRHLHVDQYTRRSGFFDDDFAVDRKKPAADEEVATPDSPGSEPSQSEPSQPLETFSGVKSSAQEEGVESSGDRDMPHAEGSLSQSADPIELNEENEDLPGSRALLTQPPPKDDAQLDKLAFLNDASKECVADERPGSLECLDGSRPANEGSGDSLEEQEESGSSYEDSVKEHFQLDTLIAIAEYDLLPIERPGFQEELAGSPDESAEEDGVEWEEHVSGAEESNKGHVQLDSLDAIGEDDLLPIERPDFQQEDDGSYDNESYDVSSGESLTGYLPSDQVASGDGSIIEEGDEETNSLSSSAESSSEDEEDSYQGEGLSCIVETTTAADGEIDDVAAEGEESSDVLTDTCSSDAVTTSLPYGDTISMSNGDNTEWLKSEDLFIRFGELIAKSGHRAALACIEESATEGDDEIEDVFTEAEKSAGESRKEEAEEDAHGQPVSHATSTTDLNGETNKLAPSGEKADIVLNALAPNDNPSRVDEGEMVWLPPDDQLNSFSAPEPTQLDESQLESESKTTISSERSRLDSDTNSDNRDDHLCATPGDSPVRDDDFVDSPVCYAHGAPFSQPLLRD